MPQRSLVSRFQSTLSMRRATRLFDLLTVQDEISIHALHEESDAYMSYMYNRNVISIHALHEESDWIKAHGYKDDAISIHALHEESDRRLPWPSAGG